MQKQEEKLLLPKGAKIIKPVSLEDVTEEVLNPQVVKELIKKSQHGGKVSMGISVWPAQFKGEPHLHSDRDEYFFFLEGEGTLLLEQKEYSVAPNMAVRIPRNTAHTFSWTGETGLRMVFINCYC